MATIQQTRPGIFISSAVPNAAKRTITINLNQAVAQNTKVGWLIVD